MGSHRNGVQDRGSIQANAAHRILSQSRPLHTSTYPGQVFCVYVPLCSEDEATFSAFSACFAFSFSFPVDAEEEADGELSLIHI